MSGLRCWPGARAIAAYARVVENRNKVVTCLRLATDAELDCICWSERFRPVWVIDRPLISTWGDALHLASDCSLVPITPPPGTDRTTHDADKPQPVEAA